jgi:uncharacterized protein
MPGPDRLLTELVLKIASRCDLSCNYCYMYELGDDTWKTQPRFMDQNIANVASAKIGDYIRAHEGMTRFRIILHGGEPLLAGADRIREITRVFQNAMPANVQLIISMQTNGRQLTEEMLALLPSDISIGVSFDGDTRSTGRHRLLPSGESSHQYTIQALKILRAHPENFGGVLAVIDFRNDPVATYEAIREQEPRSCDFLLPLATHDNPPPPGEYGRWLADMFDVWYLDEDPRAPIIRLFRVIVQRLNGIDIRCGFIGPESHEWSIVIQPDGSAELLDAMRVVGNGAAITGLNILTSSLEEISAHPGYTQPEPCQTCKECPVFDVCGGGYYPSRFSSKNGYDNPSVYCADMLHLIQHIQGKMEDLDIRILQPVRHRESGELTHRGYSSVDRAVASEAMCAGSSPATPSRRMLWMFRSIPL